MEFIIAAVMLAAAGTGVYLFRKRSQPASRSSEAYTCPHCGDRHCQCERQP